MKIAIFGASGQGREVADICAVTGYDEIVFLVGDINETCLWSGKVFVDTPEQVKMLHDQGFHFAIGIGSPKVRKIIAEKYPYLTFPNLFHPEATIGSRQVELMAQTKGCLVMAGTRISDNVVTGDFCLFNFNCSIGHDCIIENYASVMAGVNILGNVHIGEAAYIGAGSTIMHGTNEAKMIISDNSMVTVGSVVLT